MSRNYRLAFGAVLYHMNLLKEFKSLDDFIWFVSDVNNIEAHKVSLALNSLLAMSED